MTLATMSAFLELATEYNASMSRIQPSGVERVWRQDSEYRARRVAYSRGECWLALSAQSCGISTTMQYTVRQNFSMLSATIEADYRRLYAGTAACPVSASDVSAGLEHNKARNNALFSEE